MKYKQSPETTWSNKTTPANIKCWHECRATTLLTGYWWKYKVVQLLWRTICKILTKLQYSLIESINHPPKSLLNYTKTLDQYKNMHMDVYSNISSLLWTGSIQDILQWVKINKQTMVHSHSEILFNNKKKWAIRLWKAWKNLRHTLLSKKSQ